MSLEILPDLAVHKIVQSLACQGVFQLLALASISRQWRAAVKAVFLQELRLESISGFQQQRAASRGNALAAKFHILSTAKKTLFFISAARLLRQHQAVYCTGDAITDIVLLETAKGNSDTFCVEDSMCLTDASLTILIASHKHMKHLRLKNLPRVYGAFIPTLLREAKQLETLELIDLPNLNWAHLKRSMANDFLPKVRSAAFNNLTFSGDEQSLFHHLPLLRKIKLDCLPATVWSATKNCLFLEEVTLLSTFPSNLDECLAALLTAPMLRILELRPKSFRLNCDHMYLMGMMNLCELRLDSQSFQHQPLSRGGLSHVDNEGVKALVDSICQRSLNQKGRQAFKLSLCGASAISQDAVSALLRLPLLSGLMLDGCHRISSIDKMRLIAKVKAGRELLEASTRRRGHDTGTRRIQIEVNCHV